MAFFDIFKKNEKPKTNETIEIFEDKRNTGNSDPLIEGATRFIMFSSNRDTIEENIFIYKKMLLDDTISLAFKTVNSSIKSLNFEITGDSEEVNEFVTEALKDIGMQTFIDNLLSARQFGYAVFEEIWKLGDDSKFRIKKEKLLPYEKIDFIIDEFTNLLKVKFKDKEYNPKIFHIFTYPAVKPDNYFYGVSDLNKVYREWISKDLLIKYQNIGLENFSFPIVVMTYDQIKYQKGSVEFASLQKMLANIKDDARIALPATFNIDGTLSPNVILSFLEPGFASGGFAALESAIESNNTAIKRNLGLPDDLGFTDTSSGSYAKAREEKKMLWTIVTELAGILNENIQHVVDRIVGFNFVDAKAIFAFDLSQDKGLSEAKAKTLNTMKQAGHKASDKFVETYTDTQPGDFTTTQPEKPEIELEIDNAQLGSNVHTECFAKHSFTSVVNFGRIDKKITAIEDENIETITGILLDYKDKLFKKILKTENPSPKDFETPGDVKTKIKRSYKHLLIDSFLIGKTEALSELDKKQGFAEIFESIFNIETFETTVPPLNIAALVRAWEKEHGIKLNAADRATIAKIEDWAFTATKNLTDELERVINTKLITQVELGANATIQSISADLSKLIPPQINTTARTVSNTYFNDARMNMFQDPELTDFVVAYEYSAILDDRATYFCRQHDGEIILANDPNLADITPPNHFNCRSLLVPVTRFDDFENNWNRKPQGTQEKMEAYTSPAKDFGGTGRVEIPKAQQ